MTQIFNELIQFLRKPEFKTTENLGFIYRAKTLFYLLIISFITIFVVTPILGLLEVFELVNMENHAVDKMFEEHSKLYIFFTAAILAPIFEEFFFRFPLKFFKNQKYFGVYFYLFTTIFAFIHIFNFEITTNILLFLPILVLPQFILGLYLGFIRVKFNLLSSIFLHAAYNGTLMLLAFWAESLT